MDPIIVSKYQDVYASDLINFPDSFEGEEVAFKEKIRSLFYNFTLSSYILETQLGLILRITSIQGLRNDTWFFFRGKSNLASLGYIQVYDFYFRNNNPVIYSFPGIILFIIIFYKIFKIDWKNVSFSARRD
jgi:hypothetical protein